MDLSYILPETLLSTNLKMLHLIVKCQPLLIRMLMDIFLEEVMTKEVLFTYKIQPVELLQMETHSRIVIQVIIQEDSMFPIHSTLIKTLHSLSWQESLEEL